MRRLVLWGTVLYVVALNYHSAFHQVSSSTNKKTRKEMLLRTSKTAQVPPPRLHKRMLWKEMLEVYNCGDEDGYGGTIPDEAVFETLRGAYETIAGSRSTITSRDKSFLVPVEIRLSDGKGRGVFTKQDLKKGQPVYDFRGKLGKFSKRSDWRKYVELVYQRDKRLVCDALHWSYAIEDPGDSDYLINLAEFDEAALTNTDPFPNIGCDEDIHTKEFCFENGYALRDIAAGEELLCNYDEGLFDP